MVQMFQPDEAAPSSVCFSHDRTGRFAEPSPQVFHFLRLLLLWVPLLRPFSPGVPAVSMAWPTKQFFILYVDLAAAGECIAHAGGSPTTRLYAGRLPQLPVTGSVHFLTERACRGAE